LAPFEIRVPKVEEASDEQDLNKTDSPEEPTSQASSEEHAPEQPTQQEAADATH
jgi:hypothetical protein